MMNRGYYFIEGVGLVSCKAVSRGEDQSLVVEVTRSKKNGPDKGERLNIHCMDFVKKVRGIINTAPIDTADMA